MSNDAIRLGQLIKHEQQRDAVHVAVAPVTAGHDLGPGDHVGFIEDGIVGVAGVPIGIIDPFLTNPVLKGQKCWLFVYPGTVRSLRHDWAHPEFAPLPKGGDEAAMCWLSDYAARQGVTYERMVDIARELLDEGSVYCGDDLPNRDIPDEFWFFFERATGRKVPAKDRPCFISCHC